MSMNQPEALSSASATQTDEATMRNRRISSAQPDESPAKSEVVPCVTEIVLNCSPRVLKGMVAAYETAIEQAAGEGDPSPDIVVGFFQEIWPRHHRPGVAGESSIHVSRQPGHRCRDHRLHDL